MSYNLSNVLKQFNIDLSATSYGNGHINDTFLVETDPKYILQRINTEIFKSPDDVMENIVGVTEHLKKKITKAGGDAERETMTVVKTIDNNNYYQDKDGNAFRLYTFIPNTLSYDEPESPEQFYEAAKVFGRFQNLLKDYPMENLHETIIKFHDTPDRLRQLEDAIKADKVGRVKEVADEIEFVRSLEKYASCIMDGIKDSSIPLRVTHNDTKLNNILFDEQSKKAICVIDLDTVMPGSLLFDFGDALRIGACTGAEDETDLSKITFDLAMFEAFAKGFMEELTDMTDREIELLPLSAMILTYECGVRFLTDYLNGDVYFKIHRPKHNIDRARTQFKLVSDILSKKDKMDKIIEKLR